MRRYFPSPLVGEGGAQSAPDEGYLTAYSVFAERTPHPSTTLRVASTLSHKGRGKKEAGGRPFDPTVRRREDSGLHAGAGWPLCELPARAARGRRHQGGTSRRRGHAPHAAEPRMGRARPCAGLAGHQRQQAQPDARSAKAGGDRHRQAARRASRRGDGELSPRRDGQARHRLCRAVSHQSAADLLCHFRLRPDRAGAVGRRL